MATNVSEILLLRKCQEVTMTTKIAREETVAISGSLHLSLSKKQPKFQLSPHLYRVLFRLSSFFHYLRKPCSCPRGKDCRTGLASGHLCHQDRSRRQHRLARTESLQCLLVPSKKKRKRRFGTTHSNFFFSCQIHKFHCKMPYYCNSTWLIE